MRHFFPSVFDESSYAPKKYGYNNTADASKLGSRNKYGRMDSSRSRDREMDADLEMSSDLATKKNGHYMQSSREIRGNASDVGADDGSEKAIWQTRTVTVEPWQTRR